jgi:formylglycine-generating enzyme required for sulfatase activity
MAGDQDKARSLGVGYGVLSLFDGGTPGNVGAVGRVLRGGSFTNIALGVRSANRIWYAPTNRSVFVGFRPARTFTP